MTVNCYFSPQQRLNTIYKLDSSNGFEGPVSFLRVPVVVYGGIVYSAGNCSVKNMSIKANISIRGRKLDGKDLSILLYSCEVMLF